MSRSRRWQLEQLEDRCVPANWGNPWPDASHLTISFVPDGTSVGNGLTSNLYQTLNNDAPTAVWQKEILQAFQVWAVNSNINLGLVNDNGAALGSPGPIQGNPNFGSIRISMAPLQGSVIAFSSPYDPTAGTWSGDVILNSNDFNKPGANPYDLFTVAMHEAGHVFGLGDNSNPGSVMDGVWQHAWSAPSATDVANLQALYGPRSPDTAGGTFGTATQLSLLGNSNNLLSVNTSGDLGTQGDVDMYSFSAPSLTGGLSIQLQTAGLSLLTPQVTVYNSQGQVVGSGQSTDPLSNNVNIQVNNVTPLGTYYVKVQGASGTVFDVGAYNLTIQSLPVVDNLTSSLVGAVGGLIQGATANDLGLNGSFATAAPLQVQSYGSGHYHASHQASLNGSQNAVYYSVQAPSASSGANVLAVVLWTNGSSNLLPVATVYDSNHNQVNAQVLFNEGGMETLQVQNVTPGATYYVTVQAASYSPSTQGNYTLAVDFSSYAVQMQTLANSTLGPQTPQASDTMVINQSALYHFVLSANANTGTGVMLTVTDSNGNVVRQVTAVSGSSISLTQTMPPGTYTFTFTAVRSDGKPITSVQYLFQGLQSSNPVGSQPEDPTESPSQQPPSSSPGQTTSSGGGTYSASGTTSTTSSSYQGYQWYAGPGTEDPSSPGYTV